MNEAAERELLRAAIDRARLAELLTGPHGDAIAEAEMIRRRLAAQAERERLIALERYYNSHPHEKRRSA